MVYGKKEYFISRYAIRNAIKSHGHEDRINPDLVEVVVTRLDKLLSEWITEALGRMKEEGRKTFYHGIYRHILTKEILR